MTQEWLDAKDADARKKIAAAIQQENYAQVPTVTLGQFQIPTAYRKSLRRQAGVHRAAVLERQARVAPDAKRNRKLAADFMNGTMSSSMMYSFGPCAPAPWPTPPNA